MGSEMCIRDSKDAALGAVEGVLQDTRLRYLLISPLRNALAYTTAALFRTNYLEIMYINFALT